MYELKNYIKYTKECELKSQKTKENLKIPKKAIFEQAKLKTRDKNIFTKKVDKILWLYALKPNNIGIKPYTDEEKEYLEVEVIEVIMKKPDEIDRIADILQRFISYPTLLIFKYNEQLKLCVAHQRDHKSDKEKITLTDLQITNWINLLELDQFDSKLFENLKLENLDQTNFYLLYSNIFDNIIIYNGSKEVNKELKLSANEIKFINDQLYELDKKISNIKVELKKETQYDLQGELNIQIQDLKIQRNKLLKQLKV